MFPISHSEFGSRINHCTFCTPGAFSFAVVICESIGLMSHKEFNSIQRVCVDLCQLLLLEHVNYILWPNIYWAKCRGRFHSNTVFTCLLAMWWLPLTSISVWWQCGVFSPKVCSGTLYTIRVLLVAVCVCGCGESVDVPHWSHSAVCDRIKKITSPKWCSLSLPSLNGTVQVYSMWSYVLHNWCKLVEVLKQQYCTVIGYIMYMYMYIVLMILPSTVTYIYIPKSLFVILINY